MYLTHLSITDFRKISRLDKDLPRGSLLLVGGNAQGKTSLLEAIYYLATMASFRAESDRQLINFSAGRAPLAVARLVAEFHSKRKNHHLEVRLIQEMNGVNGAPRTHKEVLLDGVNCKIREAIGQFRAVFFSPQLLSVVEGAPEERRRYLNLMLSQVLPRYVIALSEYSQTLTQRNALLKQLNERNGDETQLDYWDEQLVTHGAQVMHERIQAIQEIQRLAVSLHLELTRHNGVLRLAYQPAYEPLPPPNGQYALPLKTPLDRSRLDLPAIQDGFRKELFRLRREEIGRGVTTLGPHRDELRFLENGIDLGIYGSRGQARTAMLSLKLAEVAWMKEKTGEWPVLLLDEVLAELDAERRADLLARLSKSEQTLLATADSGLFSPEFVQKAKVWKVEEGRVGEISASY